MIAVAQSLSHVWLFVTPWTAACQCSLPFTISQSLLRFRSTVLMVASNHLILCCSLLLLPSIFPSIRVFFNGQVFVSGGQSTGASASVSVLPMNIQDWFSLDGLVGSPCCPRASQESSATPQFKSIYSLVLSFLYSPTLTSIPNYWKSHSFD